MSSYDLQVADVGIVRVTKKRGMKSLRLRISPNGDFLVSAPWYVSRGAIEQFVHDRREWMVKHGSAKRTIYYSGMTLANGLALVINHSGSRNSSKIQDQVLTVTLCEPYEPSNSLQNSYIERRIIKAMLEQAEHELLPRLADLAHRTGHTFNQAYAKRLISRWGSCDSHKNITLNVYLVQLPEDLIDYVIMHELAHTRHMNHSALFWSHLEQYCPNYKALRKRLREADPKIYELNALMA